MDIKTVFDDYNNYYNNKIIFSNKLQVLIPVDGKLWIFIDELDRYKPDFAIKTLEIIKHYFNIENIVFVFSVDLEQLSNTVKKVYGKDVDSSSYLRKFFDFNYNLTSPDIKKYLSYKTQNVQNFILKDEKIQKYIILLFKKLELSLRDIDLIFNHIIYFVEYYKDDFEKSSNLYKALYIYLYFLVI